MIASADLLFGALPISPPLLIGVAGGLLLMLLLSLIGKVPVGYNIRNLAIRWRTTALTALAFTLVVSLLTVMLAFVNGMSRLTEQSGQPGNVIVLSDGSTDELMSNLGYSDSSDLERQPGILRDEHGRPLCSREVYMVVNQPIVGGPSDRPKRRFVQVRGIEEPDLAGLVHGLELYPGGSWFSTAGVQPLEGSASGEQAIQAVVGEGVAREMGRDRGKERLEVGDVFELGPRKWIVVGILRAAGSTFGSEVWAKRGLVGPMFGKENYSSLVLRTAGPAEAASLVEDLTTNFKKAAIQAQTEKDYFSKLSETNSQFLVAIIFVAAVMAVGGVFGVMNTMFAAISQRTRDIGVLRILGFKRWQILVSFLLESMVIALLGGALGVALGSLADGWTATSIVSSGRGGGKFVVLSLTVSANIIAAGLLFTLAMGALGGIIPSITAMRVKPLESFR